MRLADGRALACLQLGDPAGPPVLYCHGYPGSRLEARVAAAAAGRLGLRLLAVDRPGFGQSSFQPGRTVGAWAGDVAALADQLGLGRFSIVSISGGAPYALACAALLSDRLDRVALLCPLGPLGVADDRQGMLGQDRLLLALASHTPPFARAVVRMPVSLWQGLVDQILPAAMARRLAAALPACNARYVRGEGHLSLVVRHIGAAAGGAAVMTLQYPRGELGRRCPITDAWANVGH